MIAWIKEKDIHLLLTDSIFSGTGAFVFFVNSLAKYDSHWIYSLIVFILLIWAVNLLYEWYLNNNRFFKAIVIVSGFLILSTIGSFLIPVLQSQRVKTIAISKNEMEDYRYLKNISPDSRILSKHFDLYEPNDEKHELIMALTEKKVVSDGINYVFESRERDKQYLDWHKLIREDNHCLYTPKNTEKAITILEKTRPNMFFLERPDVLTFKTERHCEEVFNNDSDIKIKLKPI